MWGTPDQLVTELIASIMIKCQRVSCKMRVKAGDLERHIKFICGKRVVQCPNTPCAKIGSEPEIKLHK